MKTRMRKLPPIRFLAAAAMAAGALVALKAGDVGHRLVLGVAPVAAQESQTPDATVEPSATGSDESDASSISESEGTGEGGGDATAEGGLDETVQLDELTPGDIELLQQLAARRNELDARERELDTREQALALVEAEVAGRIDELKELQAKLEAKVIEYDEAQEAKLASLVKIYQNMKPKDAAPIFNTLEPDILLDVIERMKEAKVAPILALMDPARARAVTQDLARRRELPALPATSSASAASEPEADAAIANNYALTLRD
jgi:flagellar motility protein MotE (MotC chaperone)